MEITTIALLFSTLLPAALLLLLLFSMLTPLGRHSRRPLPPGPPGWPILGNLPHLGTKPHQTLAALARSYGPLFRLRFGYVDVVVACSSSVASQFLKTHDANFTSRPPNSTAEHVVYNYQDLVFAPSGPRWRMLRKICNVHLLCPKALASFSGVREQEASIMVGGLAGAGTYVDMGNEINVCMTNALTRAMMGRRVFGTRVGKEEEAFKEMVEEVMRLAGFPNIGDYVPWLAPLDLQGVVKKMKRVHKEYDAFLERIIAQHAECKRQGDDLLSVMLRLKDAKEKVDGEVATITHTEIKALLLDMFTAGTDTTSSTIEWALAELIRHPLILSQLCQEMDSVVGRGRPVSEADLPNLPFLHAVVKETLRLHPPTPLSLPRMASEACEIQGFHVPKGATLLVNVWAIGRDPDTWAEPLEFRPERFLKGGEHAHVDVRGGNFEVIPFAAGRRVCPGVGLGMRMVQLLTATLAHAFDWALPEGQDLRKLDMEEAFGLTIQRASPLLVRPIPRLLPQAYAINNDV